MSDAMTQARKFFDSFGDDITWRVCNRELYERHLAALLTETRTKALEEAAAVALKARPASECPFSGQTITAVSLTEDDPCPVCGQTGHDDGSLCTRRVNHRIAADIRGLKAEGGEESTENDSR